jgi:general secretion pathway protein K
MMQRCGSRGYALILVLWVLVLLTTIAMAFSANVRTDTRAAISLSEQVRLRAAADAAIAHAIHRLVSQRQDTTSLAGGTAYELPWPDATLHVTMASESAKIDINYAPRPLLIGLFQELLPETPAEALADALLDWRDRDERRSPQGAEAADYRAAGRSTLPSNRPFRSTAELGLVMGFDAGRLAKLLPHITVYSRRPRIDPYSADATVLAAVPGLDSGMAHDFVSYRDAQQAAGQPIRLDRLSTGVRYLERRPTLGVVNIHAVARGPGGRALAREAVVRLQGRGGRYQLLDWRQTVVQQAGDGA